MLSKQAFEALGPVFARHGWVFFGPYRRGEALVLRQVRISVMR